MPPLMSALGGRLREVSNSNLTDGGTNRDFGWVVPKRGFRLLEVSLIAIWLTEEPIGILVSWSLREVVAQEGSTEVPTEPQL